MAENSPIPAGEPHSLVVASRRNVALRDTYADRDPRFPAAEPEAGLGATLREYWHIFTKRKWVILAIVATCVVLGATAALMTTPLYTSTVRIQVDRNVSKIVESGSVTPIEGSDTEFLRTQYELLQSRALAERVTTMLNLGDDADFLNSGGFSIIGLVKGLLGDGSNAKRVSRADRERSVASKLLQNRSVRPVAGSRLVDITYSDSEPYRAKKIAASFADAFIASNLDKRFQANAYAKTFLEDQLKQLKLRLEDSEKILLEFAQKEQIVVVTEKASIAESNLAAANTALGELISARIKNEQLWKQTAMPGAATMSEVLTNKFIEGLRERRNELDADYQQKLETFKPSYPTMVQISNKIAEIDRQIKSSVQAIKDSLKSNYEASKSQEEQMKLQIATLRAEVLDLQKRSIQYNILKREVDTNRSLYDGLMQRHKEVDVAAGVGANNIFIIDQAEVPQFPSSPSVPRALLLAFFVGLGAGLTTAYLLEQLDDTASSVEEIERITGLPTLGVIPRLADGQRPELELDDPRSGLAEAYRSLCTALQFSTDTGLPKTLMVTSSAPSEGKSITSLAIARHFATMGLKVLLLDADMRNSSLHQKLGCPNDIGLSNYLTGACTPPEAFQAVPSVTNLAFMSSGPLPPNAADLLGNARLHSLLSVGLEVFDLIVIDGPPVLGLADAALLSNATAATLFVVSAGQTRMSYARGALKRLQFGRGSLIGTVINKVDAKSAAYGYGYGYGYRYGHKYAPGPTTALQDAGATPRLSARESG